MRVASTAGRPATASREVRLPEAGALFTLGSSAPTAMEASVVKAAASMKLARHPKWSTSTAPKGTPTTHAAEIPPTVIESARPLWLAGASWAAVAIATGMQIAAQQALAALVASNREKVGAAAAATLVRANRARVITRSRLLATRAVSATPRAGSLGRRRPRRQ